MTYVIIFVIVLAIVILIRVIADSYDRERIQNYIEERGGRMGEIHWDPFGPGWFGEKSDRIYEVTYLDKDNNRRRASCKTSAWTGVYFTEDVVIYKVPGQEPSPSDLKEENRRLREEIERLKQNNQRNNQGD